MNSLIQRLTQGPNWKESMRSACKLNHLCTSLAGELTPSKLNLLKQRFSKAYQANADSFTENWIEHEMRAFHWILIAISSEKNITISRFGAQEWDTIHAVFQKKSHTFIKYETKRFLLEKAAKNKNWAPDQNQVLCQIINRFEKNKIVWNQVARSLFSESNEDYFRTAKHCREHWLNYLDPSKKRGDWTKQQDFQLLEKIEEDGKKWAKLAVLFDRTEHTVKNRYNSIIAKQKKTTPNLKKQEKLLEAAKKSFETLPEEQPSERSIRLMKIKLKLSNESLFNENRSQNFMTFHEIEPKNPIDYLQNYSLEGGQYVQHLVKQEEPAPIKSEQTPLSSFYAQSPKAITPMPMGFSPSPFSFNMNCNYYIQNFNMELQRQGCPEEANKQ